jgi:hypothetical protein
MSTKTLRKRIALVAVASMGFGLLSVTSANAAAWVANDLQFNDDSGVGNTNSVLDYCADLSTATTQYTVIPATSSGVTLNLGAGITATETGYITVSGPGSISEAGGSFSLVSPTEASLTAAASGDNANYVVIKPSGVGTIKVTTSATSSSAGLDIYTIDVVAVCGGGVYSTVAGDNSYIIIDTTADQTTETQPSYDVLNADTVVDEGTGLIYFTNFDEYGTYPSSKALITTVTGDNCYVDMDAATSSAAAPSATSVTAVALSSTTTEWIIGVQQKTVGTPATCTVSTTWNGIAIGTKTIKFQGAAAKIVISDVTVGYRGGVGHLRATVTDAAGNALASKTVTASTTETNNAASSSVITVGSMTAVTAAVTGKTPSITDGSNLQYSCTNKGGAAKLTVRVLKDNVSYITSAPVDVYCGEQTPDTFSVSMDKASYAPGEIATLTVSAKGAYGTAVHTLAQVGAAVAAGFGGMEFVTAPTTADYFNSGIGTRTYTLKVGTTEGAFVGTFKMTATTDTAAKTVQYKIASTSTAVSNADVLKAIVSLIASINKQIAALQKALLKR